MTTLTITDDRGHFLVEIEGETLVPKVRLSIKCMIEGGGKNGDGAGNG